jgi:ABC-2 type transport system permease protein
MPLDVAHYHGWPRATIAPWRASLAIARVGLVQVFRRKAYWIVLALGLVHFLLIWSLIWFVTQVPQLPPEARHGMLDGIGFAPAPRPGGENGYVMFIERQSVVLMILLAFSGSLLVGSDVREKALSFYLSRRIERRHYIVGKLLAVAAVVSLLTTLPALLLFVEYGMFTSSFAYWREQWRIPLAVLCYGAVLATVLSVLLATLSAWLERMAPIAITWASLFVLLSAIRRLLREESIYWGLIDPWRQMHFVGRLAFDQFRSDEERQFAWCALAMLSLIVGVSLVALFRRVRAVDVVG